MTKTFYITTPIFYPNAKLHLGHAYTTTVTDIAARYHRLIGDETYFLTGSDENTQKMVDAAPKAGVVPMEFLDGIVANFASLYASLNISYDQFIRTTDQKLHWPGAQALWARIDAAGDLYKKEYEGLYCVGHEAFVTEKDLIDGKCPDHGTVPQYLKEENYFFRLSKYAPQLKEKIESNELLIVPESRKNEILAFIESGLEDVSFSRPRKADWPDGLGVPVPNDPTQVMYVWCDALSNYITALGYGSTDDARYQTFWPGVHVIGKDILRFHAAIWPAMLMSASAPLPKTLFVHGFITSGGKKMSKTLGNIIDPEELLNEYGTDAVRYFLARHISPFEDGDITREGFKEAYNGNLANGLGNLASRLMKMYTSYDVASKYAGIPFEVGDGLMVKEAAFGKAIEAYDFNRAMNIIWEKIQKADQQIQSTEPFKLIKTDEAKAVSIVGDLVAELFTIAILLKPVMPETASKIESAIKENRMPEALFPRKD